mmetsp:Transcript_5220/g.9948  ORF Transcript_5220/g.9948 Transcript_5220/m.9948 type:complete len:144 (+) Transcript_5220:201-632(+)
MTDSRHSNTFFFLLEPRKYYQSCQSSSLLKIKLEKLLLAMQNIRSALFIYMEQRQAELPLPLVCDDAEGCDLSSTTTSSSTGLSQETKPSKRNDHSDYFKIHIAILHATERMLSEGIYDEGVLDKITAFLDRFQVTTKTMLRK